MDFRFLNDSIGKMLNFERNGPEKITGKLLDINSDFLVVMSENEEILYVNCNHIKSLSEAVINEVQMTSNASRDPYASAPPEPPILEALDFADLLAQMKHRQIRINHGPHAAQGVLIEIRPDSITMLHNGNDFVHYPTYHIKSVTVIYKTAQNTKTSDQKTQDKKADKKWHGAEE
jgi:spore coat protein B